MGTGEKAQRSRELTAPTEELCSQTSATPVPEVPKPSSGLFDHQAHTFRPTLIHIKYNSYFKFDRDGSFCDLSITHMKIPVATLVSLCISLRETVKSELRKLAQGLMSLCSGGNFPIITTSHSSLRLCNLSKEETVGRKTMNLHGC